MIRNLRTRSVRALMSKLHFRRSFGIRRTGERTFSNENTQNIQVTTSDSRVRVEPFVLGSPTSASRCCAGTVSGWGAAPGGGAFRAAYARSRAACMMLAVAAYQWRVRFVLRQLLETYLTTASRSSRNSGGLAMSSCLRFPARSSHRSTSGITPMSPLGPAKISITASTLFSDSSLRTLSP